MLMIFLDFHDDERRASYMASRVGGRHVHREEDAPKTFLQSMRRKEPSRRRMSSTSPIVLWPWCTMTVKCRGSQLDMLAFGDGMHRSSDAHIRMVLLFQSYLRTYYFSIGAITVMILSP